MGPLGQDHRHLYLFSSTSLPPPSIQSMPYYKFLNENVIETTKTIIYKCVKYFKTIIGWPDPLPFTDPTWTII